MLKFLHSGWGYLASNDSEEQTDLHEFYNLSSSIDKVFFKSNGMSLGLLLLEEKMFMWTPQSDAIMSAKNIKNCNFNK